MAELIEVPAGLAGVAVADTEIGDVVGGRGFFHYRGRSADELARSSSFAEVAALVLQAPLSAERAVPKELAGVLLGLDLRTGLSALGHALGLRALTECSAAERLDGAVRLVSVMPTLIASLYRREIVEPDPELGPVADYLRMLHGEAAPAEVVDALETYFMLTIDHGFNNSAFAARVVASSGADLGACVVAGYASLSGPRHGANVERMLEMFEAIGEPEAAEQWMLTEIQSGRRLQGFGHSVYTEPDPRLTLLREKGAIVAPRMHQVALAAELAGAELLRGRRLAANVDLHAAVVLHGCGVPRGWFTATFAAARIVGWCAHAIEQVENPKILRPAAHYVGPPPDDEIY